jgi:hypothetical protein
MPKTSYVTMDGDLVSEINPTSRLDYKRDALGSVTGTAGPTSATENEYRYKPYGALLSQSGTGVNPLFQWVGGLGYRQTSRPHAGVYVRARHVANEEGRWASADLLPNYLNPYEYGNSSSVTKVDWSGLDPTIKRKHLSPLIGPGNCGDYTVNWNFQISGDYTGWLVQHIKLSFNATSCDGSTYSGLQCKTNQWDYYEAWWVQNDTVYLPVSPSPCVGGTGLVDHGGVCWKPNGGASAVNDTWNPDPFNCSSGNREVTGDLSFINTTALPVGFVSFQGSNGNGGVPCAQALPSSYVLQGTFTAAPGGQGTVANSWGCCKVHNPCIGPPYICPITPSCQSFGHCQSPTWTVTP